MSSATKASTVTTASRVHPLWCGSLLVLTVLLCSAALGSENTAKALEIGYVEFPPFQYQDDSGKPAGSVVELTRQVAQEAGYSVDFVSVPVGRVYLYLKNGGIDAWLGVTDVPGLEGSVIESDASPMTVELSAWFFDGTPAFRSLDDLRGRTVILLGGYTYGGLLEQLEKDGQVRIYEAPNHQAALQMLAKGRGDYLLDYRQPIEEILAGSPIEGLRSASVRKRNTAWVFSLKAPNPMEARAAFDSAYLRLALRNELPEFARHPGALIRPRLVDSANGSQSASAN